MCHKWPRIRSTCRNTSLSFPHLWLITGCVTRLTRRVQLVQQELTTLPEHLLSLPGFSGVRISRWSLVLYVMYCSSLFVPFRLAIVLSVLHRLTDSGTPLVSSNFCLCYPRFDLSTPIGVQRWCNIFGTFASSVVDSFNKKKEQILVYWES